MDIRNSAVAALIAAAQAAATDKIIAVAARDAHGVYTMTAGANGLTDVDMHAMATSGRTRMGSPIVAVFRDGHSLAAFCSQHGLRHIGPSFTDYAALAYGTKAEHGASL